MECLDEKSEREILKQYMIKEGGANENDPKLNPWIDEIVNHTYGWAQHIISYGETAAEYLQRNNHLLSDKGLDEVLISGLELRHQFYRYRLDGFRTSECQLLVDFLKANQELKSFSDEPIIHFFNQKYHNEEKSEQLFEKALERGLFHQNKNMRYVIPVPSMRTWLTEKLELY